MKFKHFETNLEKEQEYPKLVRDKIPQIIKKENGTRAETRILRDDKEYLKFLLQKIEEEACELANAEDKEHLVEETADVMEIIDAILKLNNLSMETVRKVQREKADKRGAFRDRILMLKEV